MLPDLLGIAVVAAIVAAPFVSRRLRHRRVAPVTGAVVVPPVRPVAAGGMAAPEAQVRATEPFAYSNGLVIGPADDGSAQ